MVTYKGYVEEENLIILMMVAVNISETSVSIYRTTQHNIPEDSYFQDHNDFQKPFPVRVTVSSKMCAVQFYFLNVKAQKCFF
jgi:hypothetical protein